MVHIATILAGVEVDLLVEFESADEKVSSEGDENEAEERGETSCETEAGNHFAQTWSRVEEGFASDDTCATINIINNIHRIVLCIIYDSSYYYFCSP